MADTTFPAPEVYGQLIVGDIISLSLQVGSWRVVHVTDSEWVDGDDEALVEIVVEEYSTYERRTVRRSWSTPVYAVDRRR